MPKMAPYSCRKCKVDFEGWSAFLHHKINSGKHIACVFCGEDFYTVDGRKRHQTQMHAAAQDIKCDGCKAGFNRAGAYINHIENHQCSVFFAEELHAKREKEKEWKRELAREANRQAREEEQRATGGATPEAASTTAGGHALHDDGDLMTFGKDGSGSSVQPFHDARPSIFDDGAADEGLVFNGDPCHPAGGSADAGGSRTKPAAIPHTVDTLLNTAGDLNLVDNFPPLGTASSSTVTRVPNQTGVTSTQLVAALGTDDNLNEANLTWINQQHLLPNAPKPVAPVNPNMAVKTADMRDDSAWHPMDPDNPLFDISKLHNTVSGRWICNWPKCKSSFDTAPKARAHLRSGAHMEAKLRCPACLRQYYSFTALIQHVESQAVKCNARNSSEYKHCLTQVTADMIRVGGRNESDATLVYVAAKKQSPEEERAAKKTALANAKVDAERAKKAHADRLADVKW